jgi:hypothetical protein
MSKSLRWIVVATVALVTSMAFAAGALADAPKFRNGGNKLPQAANKETVNAEVSANGSFELKNGRVQASLSAGPPSAGSFSCPPGQRLVLASVSYTNIVLTDTTNNVSTTVPDASRTFFTF